MGGGGRSVWRIDYVGRDNGRILAAEGVSIVRCKVVVVGGKKRHEACAASGFGHGDRGCRTGGGGGGSKLLSDLDRVRAT